VATTVIKPTQELFALFARLRFRSFRSPSQIRGRHDARRSQGESQTRTSSPREI